MTIKNPYIICGHLPPNSEVYITRNAEHRILRKLLEMYYVEIIQPRQHGKTSIIYKLRDELNRYNDADRMYRLIYITADELQNKNESEWYKELTIKILDQTKDIFHFKSVEYPIDAYSWGNFLLNYINELQSNYSQDIYLIIAIDEVGGVPPKFAEDFFTQLRAIFNKRGHEPSYRQVTFVLAGSVNPSHLIKNNRISPFNITLKEKLEKLRLDQVEKLTDILPISVEMSNFISKRIYHWTKGHPYLTQLLCYNLAEQINEFAAAIDKTMNERTTEEGRSKKTNNVIDDNLIIEEVNKNIDNLVDDILLDDNIHLQNIFNKIAHDNKILDYLQNIYETQIRFTPSLTEEQFLLSRIIGIIDSNDDGLCQISNRLYEKALKEKGLLKKAYSQLI